MRIENAFEVPARPEAAWALLTDVPRVLPCMPGAELTRVVDENAWKAVMHVKLGPIALQFMTDVTRVGQDEASRVVLLAVKAREVKGRGGATATVESSLAEAYGGTRVSIVTDLALQGAVAQYGRGVVASVAEELTRRFAECLAERLHADGERRPPQGEPPRAIGGLGLVVRAIWSALLRPFRRR